MALLAGGGGYISFYRKRIMQEAVSIAAAACAVRTKDIIGGRRSAAVAFARQVAMYLSHVVGDLSMRDVADELGRDRSTVSHACHAVENRREDPVFDRQLDELEREFRARIKSIVDETIASATYEKKSALMSA